MCLWKTGNLPELVSKLESKSKLALVLELELELGLELELEWALELTQELMLASRQLV
jgi:hypothetical protein